MPSSTSPAFDAVVREHGADLAVVREREQRLLGIVFNYSHQAGGNPTSVFLALRARLR